MSAQIIAFPARAVVPLPAPRSPMGGTRPVVAALQMHVDVFIGGTDDMIVRGVLLPEAIEACGGLGVGELARVIGALDRVGEAYVGDVLLRASSTEGRAS